MEPCDPIQLRILDATGASPPLGPGELAHVAQCPACREAWELRRAAAPVLEALGQAARQHTAPQGAALQARTLARLRRELRAPAAEPDGAPPAPAPGWRALFSAVLHAPRLRQAGALAALLCLLAGGVWLWAGQRPVGTLQFAQATLRLDGEDVSGLAGAALGQGAKLRTPSAGGALLTLGPQGAVRLAMAPDTELALTAAHQLRLERGAVWLNVTPGGAGFQILAAETRVTVKGTLYGVELGAAGVQVDVARGRVAVERGGGRSEVAAGQRVAAGAAGLGGVEPRPEGAAEPPWVAALAAAEQRAQAGRFIPSLTLKQPAP